MDRQRTWPDFDPRWIVYRDADLIVINKPVGIPSQAVDAGRADDVVNRLRSFLISEGISEPYLGVHQRLDRETSGLLLMTQRPSANPSIAQQFESRSVEKTYIAAVTSWPADATSTTLRDGLLPGDGGRMMVVPPRTPRAQMAVTHVDVLRRQKDRTLLKLVLETGRTHQARVQLAHAMGPIAGDSLYGGGEAPRLLLHAHTLAVRHPFSGKPLRFEAPEPPEFQAWLTDAYSEGDVYSNDAVFERALSRALERRYALGHADRASDATTAFRLIHESGDGFPKLAVDVYGGHLVVQLYGDDGVWADLAVRDRVFDRLFACGFDGIYLKIRPKQANIVIDTRREEFAPKEPVRGVPEPDNNSIVEEGVRYGVRLGDGLSTGIFLDQRSNRAHIRNHAAGKSLLNLFAYTSGFSLAAAVGGAWRTISVDASQSALDRGRENFKQLGLLDAADHQFIVDDVFAWLERAKRRNDPRELFDIVVLDPPSYSTTKKKRFSSADDYPELAAAAFSVLRPGGAMLACSNNRGMSRGKLRKFVRDAAARAGHTVVQLKDLPDPTDHPAAFGREPHLKSVWVTVAREGA